MKESWRVIGILIFGLVLALAAHPVGEWLSKHYPERASVVSILEYGAEHLGVVLVVAMLVRAAIESASQKHFLGIVNHEVKDQVAQSISKISNEALEPLAITIGKLDEELGFGIRKKGLLDEESLKHLKEKVFNPTFIRPDYNLSLRLEPFPVEGFVKVFSVSSYTVKNITKEAIFYTVEGWIDEMFPSAKSVAIDSFGFTRFTAGPVEQRAESELRPFVIDKLKAKGEIYEASGAVWLRHKLQEPIAPGETYYVNLEALQVMRTEELFVWNMGTLTQQLSVNVEFAGGLRAADFRVEALEMHHLGHEPFRKTFMQNNDTMSWRINQVLLPFQGVEIQWSPRSLTAPTE